MHNAMCKMGAESFATSGQELRNSILDLRRQLDEAAADRATTNVLRRQAISDAAIAEEEAVTACSVTQEAKHALALATTQLTVRETGTL